MNKFKENKEGSIRSFLDIEDFVKMIQGVTLDNVYKKVGFKDYKQGSVTIENKKGKLNRNIYIQNEKKYI